LLQVLIKLIYCGCSLNIQNLRKRARLCIVLTPAVVAFDVVAVVDFEVVVVVAKVTIKNMFGALP
jgi:hypothetical protein